MFKKFLEWHRKKLQKTGGMAEKLKAIEIMESTAERINKRNNLIKLPKLDELSQMRA